MHVKNQNGTENIRYIRKDHLGSWNTITDENGNLLQELSFDAWGNRRNPATWRSFNGTPPAPLFDRGFTGHEHLFGFGIINMNGRIYDPTIGRFLTPDPVLQFPNFTQGLNPYAYALNNPLRFVDPDGYSLFGQFLALTASMIIGSIPGVNLLLAPLVYSVIMTIDHAIEQGRNVKAGELYGYFMQTFVMSTISMGVTQGIGDYFKAVKNKNLLELRRALAHGAFNGAMRYAQGGKFEHGFMSGFVSSLGGSAINSSNMSTGAQVAMSAVIGGTAEKLGGGKFANGAVTGAYVMMFNHLATRFQTRSSRYSLNENQVESIKNKINEITRKHRISWLNYDPDILDQAPYWEVSFEIDGVRHGFIYEANNIEIWIGNESIIADVLYFPSRNQIVNRIDTYGVDMTKGGRLTFSNNSIVGHILEISFQNRIDFDKYNAFIKAHDVHKD